MPQSTTAAAALSPRLVTAVHPSSSVLLAAAADELARRTGANREDDVTLVMERVRDALETLGELFGEHRRAPAVVAAALTVYALITPPPAPTAARSQATSSCPTKTQVSPQQPAVAPKPPNERIPDGRQAPGATALAAHY